MTVVPYEDTAKSPTILVGLLSFGYSFIGFLQRFE